MCIVRRATQRALPPAVALLAALAGCTPERATSRPEPSAGANDARTLEAFSFPDPGGRILEWDARGGLRSGERALQEPALLVVHVFQPDCDACREEARSLERFRAERTPAQVLVIGIASERDAADARSFAEETGASYPLVVATGTAWAQRWSRGDPTYFVDGEGRIVYEQVGYHARDPESWAQVAEDLERGLAPRISGPQRETLSIGERLPAIALPDLATGERMVLDVSGDGQLFLERGGVARSHRAGIGFFSRY